MAPSYHGGMQQPQLPEPDYAEPQRQVQRWLGRCMLSLQQSERLLKALLEEQEVLLVYDPQASPAYEVKRRFSAEQLKLKTLGGLVTDFCGGIVIAADDTRKRLEASEGKMSFGWNYTVKVDSDQWTAIERGMREMVALRNECVHHLVERFDLWSLDGCKEAQAFLEHAYERGEIFREQIRSYAHTMMEARNAIKDLPLQALLGGEPLPLQNTSILAALVSVFEEFARDAAGTVAWSAVLESMQQQYPGELPAAYGYQSWPHLIDASGVLKMVRKSAEGVKVAPRLRRLPTCVESTE